VLPTAIIVETVLGKPYAKELWKIPLADKTVKKNIKYFRRLLWSIV